LVKELLTFDALPSTKKLKGRQQELMTQQKDTDNQVTFSLCFPVVWGRCHNPDAKIMLCSANLLIVVGTRHAFPAIKRIANEAWLKAAGGGRNGLKSIAAT